jgi:hypothetical protein
MSYHFDMNEILFVTAQPDVPYFHWQSKLYIHNFVEKGINPKNIHVIFSLVNPNDNPSEGAKNLKTLGVNVHFYRDERKIKTYIPSIKPYLIHKWIEEDRSRGNLFFLHDADIIFRELPNFEKLISDEIIYLSDTIGYIGYNYIIDCCKRYELQHPNSEKNQLLNEMANVVGIEVEIIKKNQENSGGGQYIIKNTNHDIWKKISEDSSVMYHQMLDYQKRYPINPGQIQFWTAEMWSLLWNLWLDNKTTKITKELDFSWATDSLDIYEKNKILHMAGVTDNLKTTKFYKGDFINEDPLEKLKVNQNFFDYIEKTSSTVKYIEVMKSFIKNQTTSYL